MAGPLVCSSCNRWWSTSGAPVCGICRIARAIAVLPVDSRVNNTNYDLATSILERALGEVNSWLAVPLAEAPEIVEHPISHPPESGAAGKDCDSGEKSPKFRDCGKDRRSDHHREKRSERREEKRQPPPPPPARSRSSRAYSPSLANHSDFVEGPVGQEPSGSDRVGRCHKKNKGKKHRERGEAYKAWRRGEE